MQRCCARIAGPYRIACRSNPLSLKPLATTRRQYTKPSHGRHKKGEKQEDYAHLTGAYTDSGLAATTRQFLIRQQQAWQRGGFGFIDSHKFPTREDAPEIESWMLSVEAALPPRLRVKTVENQETYSAQDITRIVSIAGTRYGLDLLTHLAVDQGRWKAVVWLITQIVDHNFKAEASAPHLDTVWSNYPQPMATLADMTRTAIRLDTQPNSDSPRTRTAPNLDRFTDELHPLNAPLSGILRHEALGQVWQSLGLMIVSDAARVREKSAGGAIKPEILEIIALLHHRGAMPSSIYSYQPAEDSFALRQPPTLQLLSHQIITSLTDAAWRAHETLVVEEAKAKGGVYESIRNTIPGSMYKVHVAGLGHEVWLELVLWSCLHNRFFAQGAAILESVSKQKGDAQWSVLSWRELASPIIQAGQEKSINWDEVKYIFNTGVSNTDRAINHDKVKRTVSSEVVAAFVDGLVSDIRRGVGARGIAPTTVVRYLLAMKRFLEHNQMSLGFTSWDAIILRFMDSQGIDVEQDPNLTRRVLGLSSQFGDEISAVNAPTRDELWQPTPAYVLDGTAANLGHMHRVLRSHVQLGNLRGALHVFEHLQKVTDENKQKSIRDFFAKQRDIEPKEDDSTGIVEFEGRYSGIDYPNFFPQIPATILAPFVDLVVDANAMEFGSWLLHSGDIDGPIISESLYSDPTMGPSLIRLAASIGDKDLLSKMFDRQRGARDGQVPQKVLSSLVEYQVEAGNWSFVERAIENFTDIPGYNISTQIAAAVVRMILQETKSANGKVSAIEKSDSKLLRRMTKMSPRLANNIYPELMGRVWRLLACIDDDWRDYAFKVFPGLIDPFRFTLRPHDFNIILKGILSTYGSDTGKRYLAKLWSRRRFHVVPSKYSNGDTGGVPRMAESRQGTRALTGLGTREPRDTRVVALSNLQSYEGLTNRGRLTVTFAPNLTTIRLILRQAQEEHEGNADFVEDDMKWARTIMRQLGLQERYIQAELDSIFTIKSDEPIKHAANEDGSYKE